MVGLEGVKTQHGGRLMVKPYRLVGLLSAVAIAAATMALTSTAAAQEGDPEDYGDTVHVVQPKPVLQKGRVNLTPRFGMTINDAIHRNFKAGVHADYYPTERFYVGALLEWYDFGGILGGDTQASRHAAGETGAQIDAPYLNWAAGAEVGFVPLFGKFSLFNRGIIYYNVALSAGGGWTDSSSLLTPGSQGGPAGTVGLTTRLFLNDWMALNIELRDVIYMGTVRGGDALSHSATMGAGVSFYLPTTFEYSDPGEQ